MLFNPRNEYEVPKLRKYVEELIQAGDPIEIKRKRKKRSSSQNSYLHVLIGYFASEYGCSIEEAKVDFYKRTCNKNIFERKRVNKRGQEIRYLRSSADLEIDEMTLSIERFRNWSASVAGIYLPSAEENQMLAYAEAIIEQNKQYL
ncbi:hypothetical protein EVA_22263 [gut metagenome]|uniref:Uncharacterized protein n=1 Tax=gut metagenome TaxID=749906 RepID=J9F583_9ZZZZ